MKLKNIKKYMIKSFILCGYLLLSISAESFAINENIDLTHKSIIKNFGGSGVDAFNSVIEMSDGGIVAVGRSTSTDAGFTNKGGYDAIVVKYDNQGNELWVKNFGGSKDDYFKSVVETKDGGIVAVGYSVSTNAGFTNKGEYDAVIVKYDKDGNELWFKSFGGSNNDYFYSATEIGGGEIVTVGYSFSKNAGFTLKGGYDAIVVKYDNEGNELWVKNFGGNDVDCFNSVIETSDKGFVAVGYSLSTDAGFINKGYEDAIVVKYDSEGNELWVKNFGSSKKDYFESVIETKDGGIVTVGYSNSTNVGFTNKGGYDGVIVKYDSEGNELWVKNFGGSVTDKFYSVIEMSDKGFISVGYSNSTNAGFTHKGSDDAVIVKCDSEGNELWVKNFGGSNYDYFKSVIEVSDGGIIAVGESSSTNAEFTNKGSYDAILIKMKGLTPAEKAIEKAENSSALEDINTARDLVNQLPESEEKELLQSRLNAIFADITLDLKNASANLDLYIKSENMLSMTLDTNSITFDDFSGVQDMIKENAVSITINSSLPYQLNAYLPVEIQNSDKSNTMDKDILNIKENSEVTYQTFANTADKVMLKDNCPAGNDLVHGIDIKLRGGVSHEKDIYKTTIKFEAEQK